MHANNARLQLKSWRLALLGGFHISDQTFCPMGPVLVTADEIPDPQTLTVAMRVNGETRQSSHSAR